MAVPPRRRRPAHAQESSRSSQPVDTQRMDEITPRQLNRAADALGDLIRAICDTPPRLPPEHGVAPIGHFRFDDVGRTRPITEGITWVGPFAGRQAAAPPSAPKATRQNTPSPTRRTDAMPSTTTAAAMSRPSPPRAPFVVLAERADREALQSFGGGVDDGTPDRDERRRSRPERRGKELGSSEPRGAGERSDEATHEYTRGS